MELLPHQLEAVENLGNGKILWGGVGSGKSATVLEYYMRNEKGRDIYVITTAKKRDSLDWEGEAARHGISTDRDATCCGTITIDSWNNIVKYIDVKDAFFIFDEQRLVGTGVWVGAFKKIAKKNRWVMLTATPGDTWMDYVPVFIANGLYKNATQFKIEHVVYAPFSKYPKIVRYTNVDILEKYRNMLLVEMPYIKHTNRIVIDLPVAHDEVLFRKVYKERWNIYENQPIQDVAELFRVMRKVVNSDASRLHAVKTLLEEHDRIIVFYNFDYELEILRTLKQQSSVQVAEWNGHKHQPIPNSERWVYLVQYVAGAEGWNCTETDTVIFYSLTYSYKNFMQAQGRIDRLNTKFIDLYYYILVSNSMIDKAVRNSLRGKKLFNETAFAKNVLRL